MLFVAGFDDSLHLYSVADPRGIYQVAAIGAVIGHELIQRIQDRHARNFEFDVRLR